TGTPVNVLVNEVAVDAGVPPFGFFSFALAGIPLLLGTIAIIVPFGQRLLPDRSGRALPSDLSRHARTLIEQYRLSDGGFKLRVRAGSPYIGVLATAIDLKQYPGLSLVSAQTGDWSGPLRTRPFAVSDILI